MQFDHNLWRDKMPWLAKLTVTDFIEELKKLQISRSNTLIKGVHFRANSYTINTTVKVRL